jgi:hypothetical protein
MIEHPTLPSSMVLEIANDHTIILIQQEDDDTDQEITDNAREATGESTLSSEIEDDDLNNQQEILHLDQACCDKTIRTTMVPLQEKRSCADTVVARAPFRNLQPHARGIATPLIKCRKSAINMSVESDIV